MRVYPVVMFVATLAFAGCDRAENSRTAGALFDDSGYGVITAPQAGYLNEQPDIGGPPNVTTATKAISPASTLGGAANQTTAAAEQTTGT